MTLSAHNEPTHEIELFMNINDRVNWPNFNEFMEQCQHVVLNKNIDQTLLNKLHGPIHYKIGVTCVCIQWTHVLYFVVITQQSNSPISQSSRLQ